MAAFKKRPWTPEEDMQLVNYIRAYGIWNWSQMPKYAGLSRSGKSCRLRWMNYLNPKVKRGNYTEEEDELIISMRQIGVGWSAIAARLPGRTDNEIKNRWHSNLKKRIANINIVENMMEPNIEQIDTNIEQIDTKIEQMELDDFVPLEAPKLQEVDIDYPIFSSDIYNINEGASSESTIAPNLAYGYNNSVIDPHISFWREPFSSEDEFDIDQYATYIVDPEFGMPRPQDWFAAEPFYPYIF